MSDDHGGDPDVAGYDDGIGMPERHGDEPGAGGGGLLDTGIGTDDGGTAGYIDAGDGEYATFGDGGLAPSGDDSVEADSSVGVRPPGPARAGA